MNPSLPAELKPYQIYLARASETRSREPLISYFCRLFVAEQLVTLPRNPLKDQYLIFLLDELDKDKASLSQEAKTILADEQASYQYLLNFGFRVFLMADNEDREAQASIKTSKTFLAAAAFLEVLKLFTQELDLEIAEKIRYAKWKAADIIKAIKTGVAPVAGPPEQPFLSTEGPGLVQDSGSAMREPACLRDESDTGPTCDSSAMPMDAGRIARLEQAQKQAKFAISALQYEDVQTAKANLAKALSILNSL